MPAVALIKMVLQKLILRAFLIELSAKLCYYI